MRTTAKVLALLPALVLLASCSGMEPSVDQRQKWDQESQLREASRQAGLPAIVNFAEKKILKSLYELRDQNLPTYTYLRSMDGKMNFLCNSIGFPTPYSSQYTNPQKGGEYTGYAMPQAEPNGVFSPSSSEASFVLCSNNAGEIAPVYVEERVITSPFKIGVDGAIDATKKPTLTMPK
jgi:hypothetical protein